MIARLARDMAVLRNTLLDLLFPPRCVTCRRVGEWFCASCRASIEKILPPICDRCGRPRSPSSASRTPPPIPKDATEPRPLCSPECPYCAKLPLQIDGTRAVAFFEGNLREVIHAFKYKHRTELAEPLGELLSHYLSTHPLPVDAFIAVPLHPARERARGYNQALLLARALGAQQNLPVWEDILTRTRVTRSQTELDAAARQQNVCGAFAATDRVAGARVLLIDDVCTTGATMEACGAALYARGAKSVWGLAVARSR